jgi:RNA polymerase sigma-70 factor (ECF subfamily)
VGRAIDRGAGNGAVDFREVVVAYRADIFRVARRFTHSDADAEDLAQTAVVRALQTAATVEDLEMGKRYVLRIVRNLAFDQTRARARVTVEPWADVPEGAASALTPDEVVVRDEERALPRAAMEELPPVHREILRLRFVEELDYPSLAEHLAVTEHAARQRVYRAVQALREVVRQHRLAT